MRTNTKTFEILKFIGSFNGIKAVDIEKYIVTQLSGQAWDPKKGAGLWRASLYTYPHRRNKGLLATHCIKVGDHWFLKASTAEEIKAYYGQRTPSGLPIPKVYSFRGPAALENGSYKSDTISATGSTLTMPDLPAPKIIREVEYIPLPPVKEVHPSEFDSLSIEELELEAIKVLRETRTTLKEVEEEFKVVSKKLLDAKLAEKEAASVLRQALRL